jgi:hypothetical protein
MTGMPSLLTPGPLLASATTTSVVPATLPSMMRGERGAEQQRLAVARSEPTCVRAGSSLDLRCAIGAPHPARRASDADVPLSTPRTARSSAQPDSLPQLQVLKKAWARGLVRQQCTELLLRRPAGCGESLETAGFGHPGPHRELCNRRPWRPMRAPRGLNRRFARLSLTVTKTSQVFLQNSL